MMPLIKIKVCTSMVIMTTCIKLSINTNFLSRSTKGKNEIIWSPLRNNKTLPSCFCWIKPKFYRSRPSPKIPIGMGWCNNSIGCTIKSYSWVSYFFLDCTMMCKLISRIYITFYKCMSWCWRICKRKYRRRSFWFWFNRSI